MEIKLQMIQSQTYNYLLAAVCIFSFEALKVSYKAKQRRLEVVM